MTTSNGFYNGTIHSCPDDLSSLNDLEPYLASVPIMGKSYFVHEALASDLTSLQNKRQAMMVYEEDKPIKIGPVADLDLVLVHSCIYYPDPTTGNFKVNHISTPDGTITVPDPTQRVPLNVIRSWSGRIQTKLLKFVKKISGLEEEEQTVESLRVQISGLTKLLRLKERQESMAKNVLSVTTGTSEEPESAEDPSSP